MYINKTTKYIGIASLFIFFTACNIPKSSQRTANPGLTQSYDGSTDTTNSADIKWKEFFIDPNLAVLIDSALKNNQELNIIIQEINIAQNEVMARKGAYLPFLDVGGGTGIEKVGRYTRFGSNDASTEIVPGKITPENLGDFLVSADVSWQVDIWKQLRNAKKSAYLRFLGSQEGRNFMITNLVSEISNSYYELLALDNKLEILKQYIGIQQNALQIVKLQKQAGMVTELAVKKFQAEVLKNQSRQYYIMQKIIETENRINFLVGRYPQPVQRSSKNFNNLIPNSIYKGIPSQLMSRRPDIRQAEYQLAANDLDIQVAKANFYPVFNITAGLGYEAFNIRYLISTPESILYNLAGNLVGPVINRKAIKADYFNANARQVQAAFNYEKTILNAYVEVANQMNNISNLKNSFDLKSFGTNQYSIPNTRPPFHPIPPMCT